MNAQQLYEAGRLSEAIAAQIEEVKAHPADGGRRLFLFELALFSGDLDRARRQLDAIREEDPQREVAMAAYARLVDGEQARRRLFRDGLAPSFVGEPPDHLRLRLEAVNRLREGNQAEAAALLERANEAMPAVRGTLNGKAFETIRDGDDLLAGVVEVMSEGKYFWVGLEQVGLLAMNPPAYPRDLLYIPTQIVAETAAGEVFLPALYPNSHLHPDDALKLARGTDWSQEEGGPALGAGVHTFLVDDDAVGLLEWREYRRDEA